MTDLHTPPNTSNPDASDDAGNNPREHTTTGPDPRGALQWVQRLVDEVSASFDRLTAGVISPESLSDIKSLIAVLAVLSEALSRASQAGLTTGPWPSMLTRGELARRAIPEVEVYPGYQTTPRRVDWDTRLYLADLVADCVMRAPRDREAAVRLARDMVDVWDADMMVEITLKLHPETRRDYRLTSTPNTYANAAPVTPSYADAAPVTPSCPRTGTDDEVVRADVNDASRPEATHGAAGPDGSSTGLASPESGGDLDSASEVPAELPAEKRTSGLHLCGDPDPADDGRAERSRQLAPLPPVAPISVPLHLAFPDLLLDAARSLATEGGHSALVILSIAESAADGVMEEPSDLEAAVQSAREAVAHNFDSTDELVDLCERATRLIHPANRGLDPRPVFKR